jgi:hypothetical protein
MGDEKLATVDSQRRYGLVGALEAAPDEAFSLVAPAHVVGEDLATVLGLMAVGTEVLPVASVGRVVVVVAVPVVDGEQVEVIRLELARAARADPPVQGERALAISLAARLGGVARLLHEFFEVDRGARDPPSFRTKAPCHGTSLVANEPRRKDAFTSPARVRP